MKRKLDQIIYTILIDDVPIVAVEASRPEARELCKEKWFLTELSALKTEGDSLYKHGCRLRFRPATEGERTTYDQECRVDNADTKDIPLVYLVQLDRS
jgi:hypothetical protein